MFFLDEEILKKLCIIQVQELIKPERLKFGLLIIMNIELMQVNVEEYLAPQMNRNAVVVFL